MCNAKHRRRFIGFSSYRDLAGIGAKLASLIFLSNPRWSTLKYARAYSRSTASQTFALPSSMLQISSGRLIDRMLNYVLGIVWLCRIIFLTIYHSIRFVYFLESFFLPSTIVADLFTFFHTKSSKNVLIN